MRKFLIILGLIIGIPSIIFIADDYFKSHLEDPLRVGKVFCLYYMIKDSQGMKRWADGNTHETIDELQYSAPIIKWKSRMRVDLIQNNFELICCRRLGFTLVCTYALDYYSFEDLPYFYSVVLTPVGPDSLWERFKNFLSIKVPFGNRFFDTADTKQRWLVVDFFTSDDFKKYVDAFEQDAEKIMKGEFDWESMKKKLTVESVETTLKRDITFCKKWADEEKINQNEQMKKVYRDYIKFISGKNSLMSE